jgi:hypothetical protein
MNEHDQGGANQGRPSPQQSHTNEPAQHQQPAQTYDPMPAARWETENAPDLKREFNEAVRDPLLDDGKGQGVVTQEQIDELTRARDRPAPTLRPAMGQAVQQEQQRDEQARERLANTLRERMHRAQDRAQDTFNRVR